MKSIYFPLMLTAGGGILYHISQKSIPKTVSPFKAMVLAYLVSLTVCFLGTRLYPAEQSFFGLIKFSNWSVFTTGIGIAAVEIGFLLAYRVGWNISVAPTLSNVIVGLMLVPTGILLFREQLSAWNITGIAFSIVGLVLVTHK
jgi:drug/metabolite transporter (DMT)-like permease